MPVVTGLRSPTLVSLICETDRSWIVTAGLLRKGWSHSAFRRWSQRAQAVDALMVFVRGEKGRRMSRIGSYTGARFV